MTDRGLVLMVEFTRVDHDFLVPMLCAVAGSITADPLPETKITPVCGQHRPFRTRLKAPE
jgi:hypothetical protein